MLDTYKKTKWAKHSGANHGGNAVYALGMIGALIYFIQHATTFTDGIVGILKAIVWPAILIYKVFELLRF